MEQQPKYSPEENYVDEVSAWFTYHSPKSDQAHRYELLRDSAKSLAMKILYNVPPSADRTAALRKLRECIMNANAAIAIYE